MKLTQRLISALSSGGPISRVWLGHVAVGALGVGVLSVPSVGPPVALIPLFLIAGVACAAACWQPKLIHTAVAGLGVFAMASWARAVALWGLSQGGVGSNVLASFVWTWIAGSGVLLMVSVWTRGVT